MFKKLVDFIKNLFNRKNKEKREEAPIINPTVPDEVKPKRQRKTASTGANIKAAKKRVARKKKN